jgi:hypothetical protein
MKSIYDFGIDAPKRGAQKTVRTQKARAFGAGMVRAGK